MTAWPLHQRWLPSAASLNPIIYERFMAVSRAGQPRRTHLYQGRFENTYLSLEQIPELQPVVQAMQGFAGDILGTTQPLRCGFWFNEMGPGSCTSLHHHDEDDEWLSACYYIRVPAASGCFVAVQDRERYQVIPREGLCLLFPPQLLHEVEENRSGAVRLSVAFNFGPLQR